MPQSGSYLVRRPGSSSWYVSLKLPKDAPHSVLCFYGGRRDFVKSMGTSDRGEAELLAMRHIQLHRALLLWMRKPRRDMLGRQWAAGQIHQRGGETFLATEDTLFFMEDGKVYRQEPNPIDDKIMIEGLAREDLPVLEEFSINAHVPEALRPRKPDTDDALIEEYASGLEERLARDCRKVWALYKELVGKPLKRCVREDVKPLVERLRAEGITPKTIDKRLGWLRAAANMGIKHGKLTYNPFLALIRKKEIEANAEDRRPFKPEEMALARASFASMTPRPAEMKLLWLICATTGMRLSEATRISEEFNENGIRYVIVGNKNPQSKRRVPLPECLLPHLPPKITGRLFTQTDTRYSNDMNRWLARIGLHSGEKVFHSLRHRAADRLRGAECPQDIRWELLGHETKTVAEGYGEGSSLSRLKPWVDQIGY